MMHMCVQVVFFFTVSRKSLAIEKPDYCGFDDAAPPVPHLGDKSRQQGATLKQVHVIFRHGDRAPLHPNCFPNDKARWDCPIQWASTSAEEVSALFFTIH